MKTVTIDRYMPWGTNSKIIDLRYRGEVIGTVRSGDIDEALALARRMADGFTHWRLCRGEAADGGACWPAKPL